MTEHLKIPHDDFSRSSRMEKGEPLSTNRRFFGNLLNIFLFHTSMKAITNQPKGLVRQQHLNIQITVLNRNVGLKTKSVCYRLS